MGENESVIAPGLLSLRTKFKDFIGTYVTHCHRLNHEDNGLMTLVDVIPAKSTYAVAMGGTVEVFDGKGDRKVATVRPFAGGGAPLSVSMGDLNGDAILDLIVGTGPGVPARVAAYSGATNFRRELARFAPFDAKFSGGVSVASGVIDGKAPRNNLIVGAGPGMASRVNIFDSALPVAGKTPKLFADFSPYPGQKAGVSVATGLVELMTGRTAIVTAPGKGQPANVRAFVYDLLTATESQRAKPVCSCGVCTCGPACGRTSDRACGCGDGKCKSKHNGPMKVGDFMAFDRSYTGGVTLAVDWTSAEVGGAQMIMVGQAAAPGEVRAFSSGSVLDGAPKSYNVSADAKMGPATFTTAFAFRPTGGGVRVGTTSTPNGSTLLVGGGGGITKYELFRRDKDAKQLSSKKVGVLRSGGSVTAIGGD